MIRLYFILLCLFSLSSNAQKVKSEFVIHKGKFIFDKDNYREGKKILSNRKKHHRKLDSLNKIRKEKGQMQLYALNCYRYSRPKVDSTAFVTKIISFTKKMDLRNRTFGENSFSIFINKKGKITSFKVNKFADKKLTQEIKELIYSDKFKKIKPAHYFIDVGFWSHFSIIIDTDFSNYNTKRSFERWGDDNLSEFKD